MDNHVWPGANSGAFVVVADDLAARLMERLQALLPGVTVQDSALHGLPPLQVEAAAFAWLASMQVHRRPAGEPAVTGARGPRILGALYPA